MLRRLSRLGSLRAYESFICRPVDGEERIGTRTMKQRAPIDDIEARIAVSAEAAARAGSA